MDASVWITTLMGVIGEKAESQTEHETWHEKDDESIADAKKKND